jgi:integrase/recombinase XerD
MKNNGYGQAKILNPGEIKRIFAELNKKPRNACLFAICFFTGCRISEALQLLTSDIKDEEIVFRRSITKGKLKTRTVPIHPGLRPYLDTYQPKKAGPMFPGQVGRNVFMSRGTADRILRLTCTKLGIEGASTHSFRRTALTHMSRAGVPLRHIQEVSGHGDLATLQKYLEVTPDEVKKAIAFIGM